MMIPEFTNFPEWMASLAVDFPNDSIPIATNEEDWRYLGDQLIQEDSFTDNNAPSTELYPTWKEWAYGVYFSMNNN